MRTTISLFKVVAITITANVALADTTVSDLSARGKDFYHRNVACWVCHGDAAEGRVGPDLRYGPSPTKIFEMLNTVPEMAIVSEELKLGSEDLLGLAVYIRELGGGGVDPQDITIWRQELAEIMNRTEEADNFPHSPRDKRVLAVRPFDTAVRDWQRHAKPGSLKRNYDVQTLATYDAGEPQFKPEKEKLYFYQNTGTAAYQVPEGETLASTTQVVVGDADSKEIIVSAKMPENMRGAVHTTVLSPDGRYVYIIGPSAIAYPPGALKSPLENIVSGSEIGVPVLRSPATLLKIDAMTLRPVKQLNIGGRLHHGQIFQDRYILMDTFVSDPDGLDVFLFDPETDQIVGGIKSEDLGGSNYTAWTDNEYIYILMQPGNDGGMLSGAAMVAKGSWVADLPYWVAKVHPTTWEVIAEYPYAGYRGDWIAINADKSSLFIPAAGSSNVTRLNNRTGEVEWTSPAGIGPYGAALTADESELWVSNKGEGTGMIGRTITVINAETGIPRHTLFSGYKCDHILLAPNGKEMWVTSNGEGRIYVFDVKTREQTNVIDMPEFGDPHGLVWVYYDENGNGSVVRDQGGFHNGINPALGRPL